MSCPYLEDSQACIMFTAILLDIPCRPVHYKLYMEQYDM